jgi:ABC-type cobalamin transport system permease subunit
MRKFNLIERMMLMRAYTPKLMIDFLGFILCGNFLWQKEFYIGLGSYLVCNVIGLAVAWKQDIHKLAAIPVAKILLVQARPINLVLRIAGISAIFYGSWLDNYYVIAAGAIGLITGSFLGTKKAMKEAREIGRPMGKS